jgi:hypothetical protein
MSRLVRAGLLTGVVDGLFSSVLSAVFYGSTVSRLFQGVAAVVLGQEAFNGGTATAAVGVLVRRVAFDGPPCSCSRHAFARIVRARRVGVKVASMYGPFIWMAMSLAVIPLLTHRPPTIGFRWWVQFIGHFPFVGVPIVASIGSRSARRG